MALDISPKVRNAYLHYPVFQNGARFEPTADAWNESADRAFRKDRPACFVEWVVPPGSHETPEGGDYEITSVYTQFDAARGFWEIFWQDQYGAPDLKRERDDSITVTANSWTTVHFRARHGSAHGEIECYLGEVTVNYKPAKGEKSETDDQLLKIKTKALRKLARANDPNAWKLLIKEQLGVSIQLTERNAAPASAVEAAAVAKTTTAPAPASPAPAPALPGARALSGD